MAIPLSLLTSHWGGWDWVRQGGRRTGKSQHSILSGSARQTVPAPAPLLLHTFHSARPQTHKACGENTHEPTNGEGPRSRKRNSALEFPVSHSCGWSCLACGDQGLALITKGGHCPGPLPPNKMGAPLFEGEESKLVFEEVLGVSESLVFRAHQGSQRAMATTEGPVVCHTPTP